MRYISALIFLPLLALFPSTLLAAPVTVLAPSQAYINADDSAKKLDKKNGKKSPGEVDVLITLLDPANRASLDMDLPQLFAALYYPPKFESGKDQPELINLLGDVEGIRYLDKKAWGANVSVARPGLYQFILESKPWWDEANNRYLHEQAKVALPVKAEANGWDASFGQSFEILPLTRPFGLVAPTLFSGRLLLDGKPLEHVAVRMGRVGNDKGQPVNVWAGNMETYSGSDGEFSFVLNAPGWWHCQAAIKGSPLKGPDGEMRERLRSTVFWLYVDGAQTPKNKK